MAGQTGLEGFKGFKDFEGSAEHSGVEVAGGLSRPQRLVQAQYSD
jgi:hypothetical protein